MRAYIDADILIWHLRGQPNALRFLRKLQGAPDYEIWTGALQRAEVVFFMRAGEEERTLLFLSQFQTAPVDGETVDEAGALYRKWNPSHGTDINDSFLVATVKRTGGKIYTLNKKHYPMPEIVADRAWHT